LGVKKQPTDRSFRLVFAGGGTGGHLFPAIALAEEFRRRDPGTEISFVGSRGGLEEKIVPKYGWPLKLFDVEGVKRKKGLNAARALAKAALSTVEAVRFLRSLRPDGVIGSGSYSSAPVVAAARLLGMKTAILEQNALPGLTNRALGKFVDRVYISFEESRRFFPGGRTILSGNPVRRDIITKLEDRRGRAERFSILVFGGSQGAGVNPHLVDESVKIGSRYRFIADAEIIIRIVMQISYHIKGSFRNPVYKKFRNICRTHHHCHMLP